jgi:hypothetical protein
MTRGMALDDVQDWQSGIWGMQGCKQLYKTYYYYKKKYIGDTHNY